MRHTDKALLLASLCITAKYPRMKSTSTSCADPEGGAGGLDPLKNHKNIGFLSNTGPDSMKNHKATKPAFKVGPPSAR